MEASKFVFNKEGGNVTAAGYLIDNAMLQHGQPVAVLTGGGSLFDSLGLAVPLGLFYLQDLAKKSSDSFNTSVFEMYDDDSSPVELVDDSLYDKLLAMVNGEEQTSVASKKNKITRKKRATGGAVKKTRHNKH